MGKAQYKTKQMSEILNFLQQMEGTHVTVADICDYFKKKGIAVGMTTVYRQLDKMVSEGLVAKYVIDGSSSACFEYTGDSRHECKEQTYHCKCEKCGKLIHLQCSEVENLTQHIKEHHGFKLNPLRTVFYGICSDCQKSEIY